MDPFTKVVRIGTVLLPWHRRNYHTSIYCNIEWSAEGCLSITGVEGPMRNGDAVGSCGQINRTIREAQKAGEITLADAWDADMLTRFLDVWDEWHLNDLTAGSPAQREHLATFPQDAWREWIKDCCPGKVTDSRYPSHYDWALTVLSEAGLHPDESFKHPVTGKPYRYGSAWLRREVPADVLTFLASLPDTDKEPAWV